MQRFKITAFLILLFTFPLLILAQDGTIARLLTDSATNPEETEFQVLLATALESGLLSILDNNNATLTVFAPTDEAFYAALTEMGISYRELTRDSDRLIALLTYHVVDGHLTSDNLTTTQTLNTLSVGNALEIRQSDDGILINDRAKIITSDLEASNGVVHIIDHVLIPPTNQTRNRNNTLAQIVSEREDLSIFWQALENGGLTEALNQDDEIVTLFLPTDDVLTAAGITAENLSIEDIAYYAVAGRLFQGNLAGFDVMVSQQGEDILLNVTDGNAILNNSANIVEADIQARNGVLHIIDNVLIIPSSIEATEEAQD